jgi:hypothetical protein
LIRGPRKNRFVRSSGQLDVLRSHNIEISICAEECAEDVVIEVLVGQPSQQGLLRPPLQQSGADPLSGPAGLIGVPDLLGPLAALCQICAKEGVVSQTISDRLIGVRQGKRRILLNDLLGSRPLIESSPYRVEGHSCATYADHTVGAGFEQRLIGEGSRHHVQGTSPDHHCANACAQSCPADPTRVEITPHKR